MLPARVTPALPTAIVAALELWAGTALLPWWLPLVWAGSATGWVAIAYALNRPGMLGKERAPRLAGALLFPYLATGRSVARLAQRAGLRERTR